MFDLENMKIAHEVPIAPKGQSLGTSSFIMMGVGGLVCILLLGNYLLYMRRNKGQRYQRMDDP